MNPARTYPNLSAINNRTTNRWEEENSLRFKNGLQRIYLQQQDCSKVPRRLAQNELHHKIEYLHYEKLRRCQDRMYILITTIKNANFIQHKNHLVQKTEEVTDKSIIF